MADERVGQLKSLAEQPWCRRVANHCLQIDSLSERRALHLARHPLTKPNSELRVVDTAIGRRRGQQGIECVDAIVAEHASAPSVVAVAFDVDAIKAGVP